jgi:hypothetical protein
MMNRRTLIGAAAVGAAFPLLNRVADAQTPPKTKNVVFVHGNCTSVQNPLTSLHEASPSRWSSV